MNLLHIYKFMNTDILQYKQVHFTTNLECRLVLSSLRSLIIAVCWDTVECPSPDNVEHSDSSFTEELPFTSAVKVKKKKCTGGILRVTHIKQTL
jgi:hypothetical protein